MDPVGQEYDPSKPKVRFVDDSYAPPSDFKFKELSVPRRPKWTSETTADELHQMENDTFLEWRRAIAHQEEVLHTSNTQTVVTPFEKNLQVWRQLWRVLERSSCLIQILDARNPLFYFSDDLRSYAEDELGKPMLLVINKSDYLTYEQRKGWNRYFTNLGVNHIFFSAFEEQQILDGEAQRRKKEDLYETQRKSDFDDAVNDNESKNNNESEEGSEEDMIGVHTLVTREGLLNYLHAFAVAKKCQPSPTSGRIEFGTIGFPNVGKSSIINVLIGVSKHEHNTVRVGVAAQPGKTKHFQTILLSEPHESMMLCDCPGLVFPSFVSSTADLIAAGVFPLSQMRDGQAYDVIRLICERTPIEILEAMYGIALPRMNMEGKVQLTSDILLDTYCVQRRMLNAASGTPDHYRASRIFIKDYVSGRLLFCHAPPAPERNDVDTKHDSRNEFEKQTYITLFRKTKKIREKLGETLPSNPHDELEEFGEDDDLGEDDLLGEGDDDDIDILDLLDELEDTGDILKPETNKNSSKKKHHNNKPQTKKWGKKGKKFRNKDPYGKSIFYPAYCFKLDHCPLLFVEYQMQSLCFLTAYNHLLKYICFQFTLT